MSDLRVDEPPRRGGAVRARLDRPSARNALTLPTVEHLHLVLTEQPERTLLLGSTTPGIFSAGADLDVDNRTRTELSDLLYACYEAMVTRPGVVVAVVEGPAVGGGAQLTAAADVRTASPSARWRWVGPGHGLAVGAWVLPELVGRSRGLDLTLTGRWLSAEEAVAAGLVAETDEDPWQRAYRLAETFAAADPAALARVKRVASQPALVERLRAERAQNRETWSGYAPSVREAARPGLQDE